MSSTRGCKSCFGGFCVNSAPKKSSSSFSPASRLFNMSDEALLRRVWVTPGYQSSLRYPCDIVCCQAAVIDGLHPMG